MLNPPLPWRLRGLVVLLLGVILLLDVSSMRHLSVTCDEPRHFQYGQNILNLDSTRFDDSKMPVSALNALPGAVARHLATGPLATALARLEAGRYVTVAASLLVALCVFAWARRLYGVRGAVGADPLAAALHRHHRGIPRSRDLA